jgi:hypothetical protein
MMYINKSWKWKKRRIRYVVNNNFVGKLFMRLYYKLWLIVSVIMFVYILNMFFPSF